MFNRPAAIFAPFVAHNVEWHCHILWPCLMFWGYDLSSADPASHPHEGVVGPLFEEVKSWNQCKKTAWAIRRNVGQFNELATSKDDDASRRGATGSEALQRNEDGL